MPHVKLFEAAPLGALEGIQINPFGSEVSCRSTSSRRPPALSMALRRMTSISAGSSRSFAAAISTSAIAPATSVRNSPSLVRADRMRSAASPSSTIRRIGTRRRRSTRSCPCMIRAVQEIEQIIDREGDSVTATLTAHRSRHAVGFVLSTDSRDFHVRRVSLLRGAAMNDFSLRGGENCEREFRRPLALRRSLTSTHLRRLRGAPSCCWSSRLTAKGNIRRIHVSANGGRGTGWRAGTQGCGSRLPPPP